MSSKSWIDFSLECIAHWAALVQVKSTLHQEFTSQKFSDITVVRESRDTQLKQTWAAPKNLIKENSVIHAMKSSMSVDGSRSTEAVAGLLHPS